MWFFFFTQRIEYNDFLMLNQHCISEINATLSWYIALLIEIVLLILCLEYFASMYMSEFGLCSSFLVLLFLWFGIKVMMAPQGAEKCTHFFYSLKEGM